MELTKKKLNNPRFGMLDVTGELMQLKSGTLSTFHIQSSTLTLKVGTALVTFEREGSTIRRLDVTVGDVRHEAHHISDLGQLLETLQSMTVKHFWQEESISLFLYSFVRFSVCALKESTTADEMEKQRRIIHLLHNYWSAHHIHYSPYVVTERAKHLLLLGYKPTDKVDDETVQQTGRDWMKLTHPDAPFGHTELFKCVNAAVRYFK